MSTPRQLLTACGVALAIALPSPLSAQDFWSSFGFSEDAVKDEIFSALTHGNFRVPSVPALRAVPSGPRKTLISNAAAYAKRYAGSAEFRQRYAEQRAAQKPELSAEATMTMAQRKAKDKADFQKGLLGMDSALTQARGMPEVQAGIRTMMQQVRDQIKAIDDPANPAYGKDAEAMYAEESVRLKAEHATAMKEWEARYPASPTARVRLSLREFLDLAQSVDFTARTRTHERGVPVFVNEEYEAKPPQWKALYRAGKETTAALQAAAQQWLADLK